MVWPFFTLGGDQTPLSPKHKQVGNEEEEPEKTVEEALECDYERDCTKLYRAIENAIGPIDYDAIVKFLDTGYWPGSFFADSIRPIDQVRTWVTRFDNEDPNKVKWSQLPLHLSIVCNAPASIIGRLVKLYPQALRCTDDQHMLPLHLALRHGADDEIIAFLLIRFPDAVNAKGKNGRTAVDCAMRAKDKLRGKILEIFVEKTKGKTTSSVAKENKRLHIDIDKKKDIIDELRAELDAYRTDYDNLKTLKNSIEADLLVKIQELEQSKAEMETDLTDKIERLESEKLVGQMEIQRKLDELAKNKQIIELAEQKATEESTSLRKELEAVQELVTKSVSAADLQKIKKEVELLQAYRMKHTRSETKIKIETLKGELESTLQLTRTSDSRNKELQRAMEKELNDLKGNIKKLETQESSATTSSELVALRNEVDQLKKDLRARSEASRTKLELVVLKKAMEKELRDAEGKTNEEIAMLKRAIVATNIDKLESKTNAELNALKTELEKMKYDLQERELQNKTNKDIKDLQAALETKIAQADASSKKELEEMKRTVDSLQESLQTNKLNKSSNDDLIAVKQDLQELKDQLKKKETTSLIVTEAENIKKSLDEELKKSEGKTQNELLKIKESIKNLSETGLANKDVYELSTIKSELYSVREQLKAVEKVAKTQQELDELKVSIADELKESSRRAEEELKAMKKAVDEINLEQKASKTLKESLETEIKAATGKTQIELLEMKRALDSIDIRHIQSRNKHEWDAMNAEIQGLKDELNQKKLVNGVQADSEIKEIKSVLEHLKQQQQTVLRTSNNAQRQHEDYLGELRQEMEALKASLKDKEIDECNLKREIELLKEDGKRHKAGLKSFLSKRITSWKREANEDYSPRTPTTEDGNGSVDQSTLESNDVTTIRPPSLAHSSYNNRYSSGQVVTSGSSSSEEPMEPKTTIVMEPTSQAEPLVVITRTRSNMSSANNSALPPRPQQQQQQHKVTSSSPKVETVSSVDSSIQKFSTASTSSRTKLDCCEAPLMATILSSDALRPETTGGIVVDEKRDEPPQTILGTPSSNDASDAGSNSTNKSKSSLFNRMRSTPITNNFRKVKSMEPSLFSPASASTSSTVVMKNSNRPTIETIVESPKSCTSTNSLATPEHFVRTQSKTVITAGGDIETVVNM